MSNAIMSTLREALKELRSREGQEVSFDAVAIKRLRTKLGMTQAMFAERVGVSLKTVQSWEQNVHSPSVLATAMLGALLLEEK